MSICVKCGQETRYSVDNVFQHKGECPAAPEPTYEALDESTLEIPGPPEPGEDPEFDDSLTEEEDEAEEPAPKPKPVPQRRRRRR